MSDRDKGLIEKERATNTVKHLFGQGAMAICGAINALKPIAECQDAVSREDVKQIREKCVRYIEEITHSAKSITQLLDALIEFSSPVLPAPGRSEEEIRRAIGWFHSMLADSSALWRVSACVDLIRWMQGEENGWSKLFSAPDPADNTSRNEVREEGGTGEKT